MVGQSNPSSGWQRDARENRTPEALDEQER